MTWRQHAGRSAIRSSSSPTGRDTPFDPTIIGVEDRPRWSATVGEALGRAGINIDAIFGHGRLGEIHVLVEDPEGTRRALEGADFQVGEAREVLVFEIEAKPGAWGGLARRVADAGVNIDFHYLATDTRVVLAVDDLEKGSLVTSRQTG
jgi:hypothetical protein